jgi:hypothetical protein
MERGVSSSPWSHRRLPGERFKGGFFRKAAAIDERRLSPFRPHLLDGEQVLEWTTATNLHGQDGTLAVSGTRLFWCEEPLDAGAAEVIEYQRIYAVGASRKKCRLIVKSVRAGLLEAEIAQGDIYDDYVWQMFPGRRSRLVLDIMATGMKAAGILEVAQQRFYDAARGS